MIFGNYLRGDLVGFLRRLGLVFFVLFQFQIYLQSQTKYTSVQTGAWDNPATWDAGAGTPGPNDTVVILDGHSVRIATGSGESVYSIFVESGGVIDIQNKTFSVSGTFIVDGTLTSDDNSAKDVDFDGDKLGGTGIVAINDESRYLDIASNVEVLPSTDLHLFGNIHLRNGVTVTNKGHLEVYGTLDGADAAGSVWTNDTGSKIEVSGVFMNTGVLNASATGNTVTYFEQGDQSVKTPSASTYYNLVISGTNTKTLNSDLIITNDIFIEYAALDCNGYDLEIQGNWTNEADFIEGTGNVTFNGTADQTIVNSDGEVFFDLTADKSSGLLILEDNVQAVNTLAMNAGVIDAGSNTLTLGSDLASTGALSHTAGHINGAFERWINSTGPFLIPRVLI